MNIARVRLGTMALTLASAVVSVAATACSSDGEPAGSANPAVEAMALVDEAQRHRADGDVVAARDALENAVELDPTSAVALYNLAVLDRDEDRYAEAAGRFRQLVELRPDAVEIRIELVKALRDAGDADAAIEAGRVALERFPDDATLMYVVGRLLVTRGEYDEGDDLVMDALRLAPELEGTDP